MMNSSLQKGIVSSPSEFLLILIEQGARLERFSALACAEKMLVETIDALSHQALLAYHERQSG